MITLQHHCRVTNRGINPIPPRLRGFPWFILPSWSIISCSHKQIPRSFTHVNWVIKTPKEWERYTSGCQLLVKFYKMQLTETWHHLYAICGVSRSALRTCQILKTIKMTVKWFGKRPEGLSSQSNMNMLKTFSCFNGIFYCIPNK